MGLRTDEHLYFTVNETEFKQVGIYRDEKDSFSIVRIKNCNSGIYKKIKYNKLQEILRLSKENQQLNQRLETENK